MLKFELGCYKSYPLTGISSRDSGLASKEIRISLPRLIFSAWPIHCILLVLIFLSQVTLSYISKIFTGCSVQVRSPTHPTLLILLALSSISSTQICITLCGKRLSHDKVDRIEWTVLPPNDLIHFINQLALTIQ